MNKGTDTGIDMTQQHKQLLKNFKRDATSTTFLQ